MAKVAECIGCKAEKPIHANALCAACLQRKYRQDHPERVKATSRRTYERHAQRRRAEARGGKYKDAVVVAYRAFVNNAKRRGMESAAFTLEHARGLFTKAGTHYLAFCRYCQCQVVAGQNSSFDHIRASESATPENIAVACVFCNSSKQDGCEHDFAVRLASDALLLADIRRKNDARLKAWLAAELWPGDFDELVSMLFEPETAVVTPRRAA